VRPTHESRNLICEDAKANEIALRELPCPFAVIEIFKQEEIGSLC